MELKARLRIKEEGCGLIYDYEGAVDNDYADSDKRNDTGDEEKEE